MASKAELARELIGKWVEKGKDIRSSQELLAELQKKHPEVEFKIGDITQAKQKVAGGQSGVIRSPEAKTGSRKGDGRTEAKGGGGMTIEDLSDLAALVQKAGGVKSLKNILDTLVAI